MPPLALPPPTPGERGRVWRRGLAALAVLTLLASLLLAFADPLAGRITPRAVQTTKGLLAGAAALLLLAGAGLRRRGRAERWRRSRDGLLIALAAASVLSWWNFMQFHYPLYVHNSDTFHYYIGSKYSAELGYTRLYACTAVADAEAGPGTRVRRRTLRNLETNRLESTRRALADPAACKQHFSAERWAAFTRDIAWFRSRVPFARWHTMQCDHGYNAPPAWSLLGGWLANRGPAGDRQIFVLTVLEVPLLVLMGAGVGWAFGWRVLCVALLFWGTNLFGDFGWTGGSFLRQSWLVSAVGGLCCLRRERPFLGGALLTLSALLRIFPGVLLVAVGLRAGWEVARHRRLAPAHRRLLAGCLAATVGIVSLSAWSFGGLQPWTEFAANSRVQLATPLSNYLGLPVLLSYDPDVVERKLPGNPRALDHYEPWKEAHRRRLAERAPLYWIALAAFTALLALAVRDQPDWIAAVLGIGWIPVAFQLTGYYLAILLAYAFLWRRWESIGAALCALSALSWASYARWIWWDEVFTGCSAWVLLFVVFATVRVLWDGRPLAGPRRRAAADRAPT